MSANPSFEFLEVVLEGKWTGWVINLALIPLLIVITILLPPISLLDRIFDTNYATVSADGGRAD